MTDKPNVTLPGTVEKIIPSSHPREPEKAQIYIEYGDYLYMEIRVENTLKDEEGKPVKLKKGAEVDVKIETDKKNTAPKTDEDETNKKSAAEVFVCLPVMQL